MMQQMSNFYQRLVVGFIATVFMLLAIYFSAFPYIRPLFIVTVSALIAIALAEFYAIAAKKNYSPLTAAGIVASVIYVLSSFLSTQSTALDFLPQAVLVAIVLAVFMFFCVLDRSPFVNIAITCFGILYVVVPLTYIVNISYFFQHDGLQDGRLWLLYLLLVVKSNDIAAYIMGKQFGRKKLAPFISPNKTLVGAFFGVIASVAVSTIFLYIVDPASMRLPLEHSLALSFILGILAQIGDLSESLLKRDGGVKDSNQIPGLGGILDMADSLIFTAPMLYFFMKTYFA